jgi:type I restriction enzyme S subunit
LGQIPEGWKIHKVNDLFLLNIGKTPPRNEAQWFTYNQGLQWVSIRDMGNNQIFLLNTAENLTDDAIEKFNFRIVPSDTVIMSFKLTVGKVSITTENMVTNEAIAHFNIKNNAILCKEYVYFYLQNFMFQTLGNTSSIGNAINSQVVRSMPFLLPDQHLIKKYERYITPHFKQILKLLKSNQNLKTQRDMLLPKLISGKIKAI